MAISNGMTCPSETTSGKKSRQKIYLFRDKCYFNTWKNMNTYSQTSKSIKTSCRNSTLASTPSTSPSSPPSPGRTLSPMLAFVCYDNWSSLVWLSLIFKSNHPWYSFQFSSKQSYTIHEIKKIWNMEFLVERVGNRSFERGNAATATMMRREKVKKISEQKILSTEIQRYPWTTHLRRLLATC